VNVTVTRNTNVDNQWKPYQHISLFILQNHGTVEIIDCTIWLSYIASCSCELEALLSPCVSVIAVARLNILERVIASGHTVVKKGSKPSANLHRTRESSLLLLHRQCTRQPFSVLEGTVAITWLSFVSHFHNRRVRPAPILSLIEAVAGFHVKHSLRINSKFYLNNGARGSIFGCGTMPQAGRSRIRIPLSLDFLIYLILPAALWPWGQLSL
jgi:hypothetical protein